ncbi:hypothetical protein HAX54_034712, partial [Datura stramonium]|nr:hypothetical protein [Datura stramonium]
AFNLVGGKAGNKGAEATLTVSISLPLAFFSIPPSGVIQNYFMPSHDANTGPGYNSMSFSSCNISQHGSSLSLLPSSTAAASPASSTPSISRSNIGASSALPSPSISTTAPTS